MARMARQRPRRALRCEISARQHAPRRSTAFHPVRYPGFKEMLGRIQVQTEPKFSQLSRFIVGTIMLIMIVRWKSGHGNMERSFGQKNNLSHVFLRLDFEHMKVGIRPNMADCFAKMTRPNIGKVH